MSNTRNTLFLSSILHDIGKLYVRAENGSKQHVDYNYLQKSTDFIRRFSHILPNNTNADELSQWIKEFPTAVEGPALFLKWGNLWSNGLDQIKEDPSNDNHGNLLSKIFPFLYINNKTGSKTSTYPIAPLSIKEDILNCGSEKPDYLSLIQKFESELEEIGQISNLNNLLPVLKKYTWLVPSETSTLYYHSLYEHLKLTGALSLCLYDYSNAHPEKFHTLENNEHLPIRLWCVDLSGIQKFIYNISSKNAAKSLKGRSFSLQLLMDGVAEKIIQDEIIQATNAHLVYSSGGKFFILLPNTDLVNERMKVIQQELEESLWEQYQGHLYIAFGSIAWKYLNTKEEKNIKIAENEEAITLGDLWQKLSSVTAEQKSYKFKNILISEKNYSKYFMEGFGGGENLLCSVTGFEINKQNGKKIDNDVWVSEDVYTQIELGKQLKNFEFILKNTDEGLSINNTISKVEIKSQINKSNAPLGILIPTSDTIELSKVKHLPSFNFQWYGGPEQALDEKGEPLTFEELAGEFRTSKYDNDSPIKKSEGKFNKLAILRMDVDSLGQLFIKGFEKTKASFTAYATLSSSLDWFFSGYLNTIRRSDKYKNRVNIIYSGGDDLFAIGRWDSIIDFADEVQRTFKQFTGREDLTLSAGIAIVDSRYPIGKAAHLAGEAEESSKGFTRQDKQKDALTVFDISVGWEEFPKISELKDYLFLGLYKELISSSLLYKFFNYYENYYRKGDISWKWKAAYTLARQAKSGKTEELKTILNRIKNILFTEMDGSTPVRFEAFIMACQWAILTFRDSKN